MLRWCTRSEWAGAHAPAAALHRSPMMAMPIGKHRTNTISTVNLMSMLSVCAGHIYSHGIRLNARNFQYTTHGALTLAMGEMNMYLYSYFIHFHSRRKCTLDEARAERGRRGTDGPLMCALCAFNLSRYKKNARAAHVALLSSNVAELHFRAALRPQR